MLALRFGISPEQAASAITALAPALASGIQQNAAREGGLQSLLGATRAVLFPRWSSIVWVEGGSMPDVIWHMVTGFVVGLLARALQTSSSQLSTPRP